MKEHTITEYFEDYTPGAVRTIASTGVDQEGAAAFHNAFLPNQSVQEHPSQSYLCALLMRSMIDGFLLTSSSQGAPGIETLAFSDAKPRFGETLTTRQTVLTARTLKSKPDFGIVLMRHEVIGTPNTPYLTMENYILFGCRGYEQHMNASQDMAPKAPERFVADQSMSKLGTTTYTRDSMLDFSKRYDPQPFHLSEEGAKKSLLKVLCASGWQSVVAFENLRQTNTMGAPEWSHITNLKWVIPVLPDHKLSFYNKTLCDDTSHIIMTQHTPQEGTNGDDRAEVITMSCDVTYRL